MYMHPSPCDSNLPPQGAASFESHWSNISNFNQIWLYRTWSPPFSRGSEEPVIGSKKYNTPQRWTFINSGNYPTPKCEAESKANFLKADN